MSNGKKKLSTLLATCIVCAGVACADTYKNNVVDVRVNNENGNAVKVIIYTDRPYTDPVVVNKKANNKYVILMPETNSSLKSSPTVTNGSGTISNVSVNTQSVSGGKGYTKITITSEKAINVVPRTQQMVAKKSVAQTKPATKPATQTTATKPQPTNTQKLAQEKAKQEAIKKAAAEKARQEKAKKLAQEKSKQEQAKKLAQQKAQQQKLAQQKSQEVKPQPQPQPIEILEKEVKTGQYANVTQDKNDDVLNKEIKENLANKPKKKNTSIDDQKDKKIIENIKSILKDYKNISIWKLLLLAGAVTFPILVIMVILGMDKKINKKIDASFKREEDITEEYIPEDIPPVVPDEPVEEPTTFNSFDEMLDRVNEPEMTFQEQITTPEEHNLEPSRYEFNNDYRVDDFEPEQVDISEPVQNVIKEVQEIKEVEEIPEIQDLKEVQEPLQLEPVIEPLAPIQEVEPEPYNPDGYLADFAGINDKDFFDELAIQTMASNNTEGLPEPSPADEVFNFMNEDEPQQEPVKEMEPVNKVEAEPVKEVEAEPVSPVKEEPQKEEPVASQSDDELTMLTEVKLNDTTGIYLVNYDNFSSLVGHINDDYFVLKKFDELVTGQIFYKEAEKLKDSKRYLVRVGKNKMVVEVTPESMTRLIDL